jgi:hypothetical protein
MTKPDIDLNIEEMLANRRPKRYGPYDKRWMDPVIDEVAKTIPAGKAKRVAATLRVQEAERSSATRGGNLFRQLLKEQRMPANWQESQDWPVIVERRKLTVKFGELTAGDLRLHAGNERRAAAQEFRAREDSCEGAELLADWLEDANATNVKEWWRGLEEATG